MFRFVLSVIFAGLVSSLAFSQDNLTQLSNWPVDKTLYPPALLNRLAAADSKTVPVTLQPYTRYLSLGNIPASQRDLYFARVSYLINSLSRERYIKVPARVADGVLIRLNLMDYNISPKVWDKLEDLDPYFHDKVVIIIEKKWGGGTWTDGKHYDANTFTYTDKVVRTSLSSILDPIDSERLVTNLQSKAPLLRADWFLATASLPPTYYDFLELKTLTDAKKLALYDERALRFHQSKATMVFSGKKARKVARNNRILEYVKTVHGSWWETHDFVNSIAERNVVNNFLRAKRDGGEIIFTLPNGLNAYFLVDGNDKRADEVPINIATDSLAHDARVRTGRSCIWCHQQGIQPFVSDFKLQVTPQTLVDLGLNVKGDEVATVKLAAEIRRVFSEPNFDKIVKEDASRYAAAVLEATATTSPANAALFKQLYDDYAEHPMDMSRLVYEGGVHEEDVKAAIKLSLNGVGNGVLLRQILEPPLAIERQQWEESAQDFLRRVAFYKAGAKK